MEATHSLDHVNESARRSVARAVPSARPQLSRPDAPTDSIAWLFVMPITLALLVAFSIMFPLR